MECESLPRDSGQVFRCGKLGPAAFGKLVSVGPAFSVVGAIELYRGTSCYASGVLLCCVALRNLMQYRLGSEDEIEKSVRISPVKLKQALRQCKRFQLSSVSVLSVVAECQCVPPGRFSAQSDRCRSVESNAQSRNRTTMMRVRSNSRPVSSDRLEPGRRGMSPCDTADDVLLVGFKRTLHPPVPGKKHSYRYPHHHHHHHHQPARRTPLCTPASVLRVSKFLSFLLFLVICDSQTVSRVAFRTSAATVRPPAPAAAPAAVDADTDSIIISSSDGDVDGGGGEAAPTSGAAINHTKLQEIVLEGLGLSALPDVRL
uniref:Uncharacterized protein n=1 Tax=Anopheles dirus TaxID=7168 RepID=A0A182N3P1_9DIPT